MREVRSETDHRMNLRVDTGSPAEHYRTAHSHRLVPFIAFFAIDTVFLSRLELNVQVTLAYHVSTEYPCRMAGGKSRDETSVFLLVAVAG